MMRVSLTRLQVSTAPPLRTLVTSPIKTFSNTADTGRSLSRSFIQWY
jgi:hypothetical protein